MTKYRMNGKPKYLTMDLKKLNKKIGDGKWGSITSLESVPEAIKEANGIQKKIVAETKYDIPESRQTLITKAMLKIDTPDFIEKESKKDEKALNRFLENTFNAEIDTIREAMKLVK